MDEVESPCAKICTLDSTAQWCLGCGRTTDEIADWQFANRAQRLKILDELPARLLRLNQKTEF